MSNYLLQLLGLMMSKNKYLCKKYHSFTINW
jgi:hypothetical protein